MKRGEAVIVVKTEPTFFILRNVCPYIEDVAIYWSIVNNAWCISCKCTEEEYWTIKNFFES